MDDSYDDYMYEEPEYFYDNEEAQEEQEQKPQNAAEIEFEEMHEEMDLELKECQKEEFSSKKARPSKEELNLITVPQACSDPEVAGLLLFYEKTSTIYDIIENTIYNVLPEKSKVLKLLGGFYSIIRKVIFLANELPDDQASELINQHLSAVLFFLRASRILNDNIRFKEADHKQRLALENSFELGIALYSLLTEEKRELRQNLRVVLKQLLCFVIAPPDNLYFSEAHLGMALKDRVFDSLYINPKPIFYEIIALCFAGGALSSKKFTENIGELLVTLESKLETFKAGFASSGSNKEEIHEEHETPIIALLRLLTWIAKNDFITDRWQSLHHQLYRFLKWFFTIKEPVERNKISPELQANIISFIRCVLSSKEASSDKKFIDMLYYDILGCIDKENVSFITSIIAPILTYDSRKSIPVVIHPLVEAAHLENLFERAKNAAVHLINPGGGINGLEKSNIFLINTLSSFESYFQQFIASQNLDINKISWNKLLNLKGSEDRIRYSDLSALLKQKTRTLFLFKGESASKQVSIGVFIEDVLAHGGSSTTEVMKSTLAGDNLMALSTELSFYFVSIDKETCFFQAGKPDSNLVQIAHNGISFQLAGKTILYHNFGNTLLSSVQIPMKELGQSIGSINKVAAEGILSKAKISEFEIWSLNPNSESFTFSGGYHREVVSNICSSLFSNYTNDSSMPVPVGLTIREFLEVLQREDYIKSVNIPVYIDSFEGRSLIKDREITMGKLVNKGLGEHISLYFEADCIKKENKLEFIVKNDLLFEKVALSFPAIEYIDMIQGWEKLIKKLDERLKNLSSNQVMSHLSIYFFELNSFLKLPGLTTYLFKDRDYLSLILSHIFSQGQSDILASSESLYLYHKILIITYESLRLVFENDSSAKIRKAFFQNRYLLTCLTKLTFYYNGDERRIGRQSNYNSKGAKEKIIIIDHAQPKGIGYSSMPIGNKPEIPQTQNRNEGMERENYFNAADKYSTRKICAAIFGAFKLVFNPYCFEISEEEVDLVEKSELVELIINNLRSTNITELGQEGNEIFFHLLDLIENIARFDELLHLIVKDKFNTSILSTLKILRDQANFISLNPNKQKNDEIIENFYNKAKKVFQQVKQSLMKLEFLELIELNKIEEFSSAKILVQDASNMEQFYPTLMKPLQIQQFPMLVSNSKHPHHYSSSIQGPLKPEVLNRLSQEITDLSNSLPSDSSNAIFVRYDPSRIDCMRALIMGARDTPYSSGAFVFDIAFPPEYPNQPPRVNLTTTGNGTVRFNPNLYHCGKVCLSLLGTWRGNASENWNPSISTLLQVLLSIQAIVMSEWVYFNEPGFEHEMGKPKGKLCNTAYSNIVKISNIRHAMIGQIKNPFPGFEQVILSHFYLKKSVILEECNKWISEAEEPAEYTGLVQSHNGSICTQIAGKKYKELLITAVNELQQELDKMKLKIGDLEKFSQLSNKNEKAIKIRKTDRYVPQQRRAKPQLLPNVVDLSGVDVTYEERIDTKTIDINDSSVTNRWSRYIGAMGIEAVTKQANASVLLYGLGPLGAEVAKNIVLSGLRRLTLYDKQAVKVQDLSGQFFLSEKDVGFKRDARSLQKVQQLNLYVNVDVVPSDSSDFGLMALTKREDMFQLKCYQVVVMTEGTLNEALAVDEYCRSNGIFFIFAEVRGLFGRVINDFGDVFEVIDKDGEPIAELVIRAISAEGERQTIHFLEGVKHDLNAGDLVVLNQIEEEKGAAGEVSLNGASVEIKETGKDFIITDSLKNHRKYIRNGVCKQVKKKIVLSYKSVEKVCDPATPISLEDHNIHEIDPKPETQVIHYCFACLNEFIALNKRLPESWSFDDYAKFFLPLFEKRFKGFLLDKSEASGLESNENLAKLFCFTAQAVWPPLAAFFGGTVAQEIIKAITHKFVPIRQIFYMSCHELTAEKLNQKDVSSIAKEFAPKGDRYDNIRICCGENLMKSIRKAKVFMIGAGAIGCELMKNYAMIGCGTEGEITLTDPDVIENSNLNRQFLFREKHIRKPKSAIAAAATISMNPDLKGRINARLDRVHALTENIYDEEFFRSQDVVLNALDNINARKFIDMKCIEARRPMIDSGTLGPKGHVQVVIPFQTESYGSQADPEDEKQIPICTLKMFPEETIHCVEWARDKFGRMFTQKPQSANRVALNIINPGGSLDAKTLKEGLAYIEKRPESFIDCIRRARLKFEKLFAHDILQLLKTYPLDHCNKDGSLFWTFPKRAPAPLKFSIYDEVSLKAVRAYSCLLAYANKIPIPAWASELKQFEAEVEGAIKSLIVPQFCGSSKKAEAMMKQGEKGKEANQIEVEAEAGSNGESEEAMMEKAAKLIAQKKLTTGDICAVAEFEKDVDDNHHIDFIHAFANLRARNYKLEPMDWINVKLKAGRIIPALATTTACISALQINEMCKILSPQSKLVDYRNAFLSLAIPLLVFGEPIAPAYSEINPGIRTCLWDRWEVVLGNETDTVGNFLNHLRTLTGGLLPRDIFYDSKPLFLHSMMNLPEKEEEREALLNTRLLHLIEFKDGKYADLTVTFVRGEGAAENVKNIPMIRLLSKPVNRLGK